VTVKATPHRSGGKTGGGRTGPNCDGFLRIATNRLDLSAELVRELYRLRWLIENFVRMFKQLLGCHHLLSTKPIGVEIQVICGIITRPSSASPSRKRRQSVHHWDPNQPTARPVPNRITPAPNYPRIILFVVTDPRLAPFALTSSALSKATPACRRSARRSYSAWEPSHDASRPPTGHSRC
jgi:hypothetical protein